jgi:hypothetical protein
LKHQDNAVTLRLDARIKDFTIERGGDTVSAMSAQGRIAERGAR